MSTKNFVPRENETSSQSVSEDALFEGVEYLFDDFLENNLFPADATREDIKLGFRAYYSLKDYAAHPEDLDYLKILYNTSLLLLEETISHIVFQRMIELQKEQYYGC